MSKLFSMVKYLLNIDWLEVSLRGDLSFYTKSESFKKGDFVFTNLNQRTRLFDCLFTVHYRDELFGTISFSPRSAVIPDEMVQFKVNNEYFYKGGKQLRPLNLPVKLLADSLDLKFHNFTRVDISLDFHQFNDNLTFEQFVNKYHAGEIESKGRVTRWNPFYQRINGLMQLTGFSIGSRSSNKYIRCYNKSHEITESHKTYIVDWWRSNGLATDKTVFRFELQLTSKWFKEVLPFRLDDDGSIEKICTNFFSIQRYDSLLSLFELGLKNYFDFFIPDHTVRNDRKESFLVIDFAALRGETKKEYIYNRAPVRHTSFSWRQKMIVVRNLFREYIVNVQERSWLKQIVRIVTDYDLQARWDKMCGKYIFEFLKLVPYRYAFNWTHMLSEWAVCLGEIKAEKTKLSEGIQTGFRMIFDKASNNYVLRYERD